MPAGAANITINTSGATPFLYQGHTYLPLQSVASFLGAPLRWEPAKSQAVITYNGKALALTSGKVKASFNGQPVVLSSPPVVVGGRTYIPTDALKKFYNVPVAWDAAASQVKIKGPSGWGTANVSSRPPWHGGPPPWAPAWGRRGQGTPNHPGQQTGKSKQHGKAGTASATAQSAQHKNDVTLQGKTKKVK